MTRRFAQPPVELAIAAPTAPYVAPFEHAAAIGLAALVLTGTFALLVTVIMTTRLARLVNQL